MCPILTHSASSHSWESWRCALDGGAPGRGTHAWEHRNVTVMRQVGWGLKTRVRGRKVAGLVPRREDNGTYVRNVQEGPTEPFPLYPGLSGTVGVHRCKRIACGLSLDGVCFVPSSDTGNHRIGTRPKKFRLTGLIFTLVVALGRWATYGELPANAECPCEWPLMKPGNLIWL